MLNFLFRTLTANPARGASLFDAVTAEARRPHWYIAGGVPDSFDGRFAMVATITALTLVRLEQFGDPGNQASVALTERFIEVMESEHRELGLGDPTLGKKVRMLVASLARRVEQWRAATRGGDGERDWAETARDSVCKGDCAPAAVRHIADALRKWWGRLESSDLESLVEGRIQ
ncbi:MAG: ubiquinol-cytochrome C chaperone family protein [Sphingomicrobium sp.]